MPKFYRIYWSKKFNWKKYAEVYNNYTKTKNNYYSLSAEILINSSEIKEDFVIADFGCGTGALTEMLLKKFPQIHIIAVDISKEVINHYKNNFKKQIDRKQIKVIQGNAEEIYKSLNTKVDKIFISSALWDMDIQKLFKNIQKVLKSDGEIITNLPSIVLGEERGFIYEIENFFKKEKDIQKLYKRIPLKELDKIINENNLTIYKKEKYNFNLSKQNIKQFFDLLTYRYPFIFFSDKIPYKERYEETRKTFNKFLEAIPNNGLEEEGIVLTIKKD